MSAGFLLPIARIDEYQSAVEEFPAYGSVLLRLANIRLRQLAGTDERDSRQP